MAADDLKLNVSNLATLTRIKLAVQKPMVNGRPALVRIMERSIYSERYYNNHERRIKIESLKPYFEFLKELLHGILQAEGIDL